jgi:hypothetical protein
MTVQVMYIVLAIIIQMGHNFIDALRSYWLIAEHFFIPFYTNTMKCDRFLHILRFLHFSDNMNQPNKNDNKYDKLWKVRTLFYQLNDAFAIFYIPSENSAVDEFLCCS